MSTGLRAIQLLTAKLGGGHRRPSARPRALCGSTAKRPSTVSAGKASVPSALMLRAGIKHMTSATYNFWSASATLVISPATYPDFLRSVLALGPDSGPNFYVLVRASDLSPVEGVWDLGPEATDAQLDGILAGIRPKKGPRTNLPDGIEFKDVAAVAPVFIRPGVRTSVSVKIQDGQSGAFNAMVESLPSRSFVRADGLCCRLGFGRGDAKGDPSAMKGWVDVTAIVPDPRQVGLSDTALIINHPAMGIMGNIVQGAVLDDKQAREQVLDYLHTQRMTRPDENTKEGRKEMAKMLRKHMAACYISVTGFWPAGQLRTPVMDGLCAMATCATIQAGARAAHTDVALHRRFIAVTAADLMPSNVVESDRDDIGYFNTTYTGTQHVPAGGNPADAKIWPSLVQWLLCVETRTPEAMDEVVQAVASRDFEAMARINAIAEHVSLIRVSLSDHQLGGLGLYTAADLATFYSTYATPFVGTFKVNASGTAKLTCNGPLAAAAVSAAAADPGAPATLDTMVVREFNGTNPKDGVIEVYPNKLTFYLGATLLQEGMRCSFKAARTYLCDGVHKGTPAKELSPEQRAELKALGTSVRAAKCGPIPDEWASRLEDLAARSLTNQIPFPPCSGKELVWPDHDGNRGVAQLHHWSGPAGSWRSCALYGAGTEPRDQTEDEWRARAEERDIHVRMLVVPMLGDMIMPMNDIVRAALNGASAEQGDALLDHIRKGGPEDVFDVSAMVEAWATAKAPPEEALAAAVLSAEPEDEEVAAACFDRVEAQAWWVARDTDEGRAAELRRIKRVASATDIPGAGHIAAAVTSAYPGAAAAAYGAWSWVQGHCRTLMLKAMAKQSLDAAREAEEDAFDPWGTVKVMLYSVDPKIVGTSFGLPPGSPLAELQSTRATCPIPECYPHPSQAAQALDAITRMSKPANQGDDDALAALAAAEAAHAKRSERASEAPPAGDAKREREEGDDDDGEQEEGGEEDGGPAPRKKAHVEPAESPEASAADSSSG